MKDIKSNKETEANYHMGLPERDEIVLKEGWIKTMTGRQVDSLILTTNIVFSHKH